MANDPKTDQLIRTLIARAAMRFAQGKSRTEVIAELLKDGASQAVAEAIATRGEAANTPLAGVKQDGR